MAVGQHKTTPTRLPGSPMPTIPRRAQTRPSPSSAEPGSAEPVKHASRCFPARADVPIGGKQTLVWDEQRERAKSTSRSCSRPIPVAVNVLGGSRRVVGQHAPSERAVPPGGGAGRGAQQDPAPPDASRRERRMPGLAGHAIDAARRDRDRSSPHEVPTSPRRSGPLPPSLRSLSARRRAVAGCRAVPGERRATGRACHAKPAVGQEPFATLPFAPQRPPARPRVHSRATSPQCRRRRSGRSSDHRHGTGGSVGSGGRSLRRRRAG